MKVKMALCFLDEYDKIVAQKDLNVTWSLPFQEQSRGRIEDVLVMDEVAAMLNHNAQENLYSNIRELLDKVNN